MGTRILPNSLLVLAALACGVSAQASPVTSSIGLGGLTWQASPLIVGQTSTDTVARGGDPIFLPSMPRHSGVVALGVELGAGLPPGLCTGALLSDRLSVLTAAHCVSLPTASFEVLGATAFFFDGADPDAVVPFDPAAAAVSVAEFFVHPSFTGFVFDQNDIAVLRLAQPAPDFAVAYGLAWERGLDRQRFNVAGYGLRSDTGGAVGVNLGAGILRQGYNRYEFRLGDSIFDTNEGNGWVQLFLQAGLDIPLSQIAHIYLSDFDNGLAANDAACLLTLDLVGADDQRFCDLGLGALEVGLAEGDSGSPQFNAAGLITSIASFVFTPSGFGIADFDLSPFPNSTWGEFNGFVPVYIHRDFISAHMVPAPPTLALVALALLCLVDVRRRYIPTA